MSALWSEDGQRNGRAMTMTKYSEIEIQTAKNLLKEGYKWIKKTRLGSILAYENKPTENPETFIPGTKVCTAYVSIFDGIKFGDEPTSLESIVHPQILDDTERRYLSAVIRPFRKNVTSIRKIKPCNSTRYRISIFVSGYGSCDLPWFDGGTMYKGMEKGKVYTPEELGL